jgi:hypothetical protein
MMATPCPIIGNDFSPAVVTMDLGEERISVTRSLFLVTYVLTPLSKTSERFASVASVFVGGGGLISAN